MRIKPAAPMLLATLLGATAVAASDHWFFLIPDSRRSTAEVQLTGLTNVEMGVQVLSPDPALSVQTTVALDPNSLYASVDLKALLGRFTRNEMRLCRATALSEIPTFATLVTDEDSILAPGSEQSFGTHFFFPMGPRPQDFTVVVGNPSSEPLSVIVSGGGIGASVAVPGFGVVEVPLEVANTHYQVQTIGQPIVVGLLFHRRSGEPRMTMLLPVSLD